MNTVTLSWRYLMARPLATALNLLLLTLGLAAVSFVLLTRAQIERAFDRDLAGIDAVVGAKGSPLQLILWVFSIWMYLPATLPWLMCKPSKKMHGWRSSSP